ncbi:carbohydrate kinase family protein [Candidatus Woesearchaeota archaeon]|nr:carbohydrate kinase family protein [Candidatus Woesearchaeota archaeon]
MTTLLDEVLGTLMKRWSVACYGIANQDQEFPFTQATLREARVHPVFDRYARQVLATGTFSEFGISDAEFMAIRKALLRSGRRPRLLVGGNAGNMALQAAALGMETRLVAKSVPRTTAAALKKAGVTLSAHRTDDGNDSLIFQVGHDRFILSKPSGMRRVELDPRPSDADLNLYGGAHLDGRTPTTHAAFLRALKRLPHPLLVELGDAQASPYAARNDIAAAMRADILSMNGKEARELSGRDGLVDAVRWFAKRTRAGIVLVHTAAGSLAASVEESPALCHAQMLGGLAGTGRVVAGKPLTLASLRRRFAHARFQTDPLGARFRRCGEERRYGLFWSFVPAPIPAARRFRMVGAGDSFAAGFAAGLLAYGVAQDF